MLQNRPRLVLLDALRHHVNDIVHHGGAQLQIKVGLDALLGDGLGDALAVAALKLSAEQVAQPALQQRRHAAHEEEPDPPAGRPEAAARPLAHRAGVEAVVDDVLEVLAHADLFHQLVLVPVHACTTTKLGREKKPVLRIRICMDPDFLPGSEFIVPDPDSAKKEQINILFLILGL